MRHRNLAFAFVLAMTAAPSTLAGPILSDFNLVVGGNLDSITEVEGRTVVRGNVVNGTSNYATRLTPSGIYSDVNTLVVGGNVNVPGGNLNITAGDVRLGGALLAGNINLNGVGGQLFQNDPTAAALATLAVAEMNAASSFFDGLAANSTVGNPPGPSAVVFTATPGPDGFAVFTVDGSVFSDPDSQQYELVLGPGVTPTTTFVFNVLGTNISFNQGNFVGAFTDPSLRPFFVWNFGQAESVSLTNQFFGAVLAPGADLTNFTAIEGSVFIGGDFLQRGEVHLPTFAGSLGPNDPVPTVLPEPASWLVLLGLGVPGLLLAYRQRRRAASAVS